MGCTPAERVEITVGREGTVRQVTLVAPDSLNAVDAAMLSNVADAIDEAAKDPVVRVIVLTGTGRAFCSGADLGAAAVPEAEMDRANVATIDAANRLTQVIISSQKPVVCGLNGLAAGVGVSIALACDLIVARESAYFLLAFTKIGLMPDGGATALVAASLGRSRALQLTLLAERLPAREAAQAGLVYAVGDDTTYLTQLEDLVNRLATAPTLALGKAKVAVNHASMADLDEALERERSGQLELAETPDFAEGVDAFLNRRSPQFTGSPR